MKKIFLYMPLILLLVFLSGCFDAIDPTEEELKKAQNFDIERIQGSVASLSVRYFIGDLDSTKDIKGTPYYYAAIVIDGEGSEARTEEFKGLPQHIFDTLKDVGIGGRLPTTQILTMQQLAKMEGMIADKIPFPEKNKFFVVIDDYATIRLYRVDMATYYSKKVFIEAKLPITLEE